MSKNTKRSKALVKTAVSGSYVGTQTPIERLRNKLTPFITLAEVLHRDKNFEVEELTNTCNKYKEDVLVHLSDCENFYKQKEIDFAVWVFRNEFTLFPDGEWYNGMGKKFSNDELYCHYLQNTSK